ncbi:MAG: hypothetical protein KDK41_03330 [Leptospiraceae bacterium]|nr:hypothetical protein [Leptospiraceae bacterium]
MSFRVIKTDIFLKLSQILIAVSLLCAISFLFLAFLIYTDSAPEPGDQNQLRGWLLLTLVAFFFMVVGIIAALILRKAKNIRQRIIAFAQTRAFFSVRELADALQIDQTEVVNALLRITQEEDLGIAWHPARSLYVQKNSLGAEAAVVDNCKNCGANLQATVILPGENPTCQYCGGLLKPA